MENKINNQKLAILSSLFGIVLIVFFNNCNLNNDRWEDSETPPSYLEEPEIPEPEYKYIRYINPTASGNNSGADWSNAFTTIPVVLERDTLYYLADGDYGEYSFDDQKEGEKYIGVYKATEANHGTEVGWSSTYGDDQALFSQINFYSPYYELNGQVGEGTTEYGIYIHQTGMGRKCIAIYNTDNSNAQFIIVNHVEMEHSGMDSQDQNSDILFLFGYDGDWLSDLWFSNCYLHDVTRTLIFARNTRDVVFDHCVFENCQNNQGIHGEGVSWNTSYLPFTHDINVTWKYSVFKDIEGAGNIVIGLQHNEDARHHRYVNVYGNVFYSTDSSLFMSYNGVVTALSGNYLSYVKFHNNTLVNLNSGFNILNVFNCGGGVNNFAYNNLIFNWQAKVGWINIYHDYNWYYGSDEMGDYPVETHSQIGDDNPFKNSDAADFHLENGTDSGVELELPFNQDIDGNIRGLDGTWDRGAYEN